jgi:hypothetical protein
MLHADRPGERGGVAGDEPVAHRLAHRRPEHGAHVVDGARCRTSVELASEEGVDVGGLER